MLAACSAWHNFDLMDYLWHDDHPGRPMLDEVVKAADRGVKVRLLFDDINSRESEHAYLSLDSHPNIELRLFNPTSARNGSVLRWVELAARLFALTRRMHNKAWIMDGKPRHRRRAQHRRRLFRRGRHEFPRPRRVAGQSGRDQTSTIFGRSQWPPRAARCAR